MNKIKLLTFLLTLVSFTCFSLEANAEDTNWIEVSTAAEFSKAVKNDHHANIRLMNDIDMASLSKDGDYLFNFTFSGKIDGQGTYDGQQTSFALLNLKATLFNKLDGAKLTEFVVAESTFEGRDTGSGMLANTCDNSTFKGLLLNNVTAVGDKNSCDCDYMGGIVGKATSSNFEDLVFTYCRYITDGSYLGHVTGYAEKCNFKNCIVNAACELWADGNMTSDNSAYAGGICGKAKACNFKNCTNCGIVSSDDDRIGGIVGYASDDSSIEDCYNIGVVKHCKKDGYGRAKVQDIAIGFALASATSGFAAGVSGCTMLYWGGKMHITTAIELKKCYFIKLLICSGDLFLGEPWCPLIGVSYLARIIGVSVPYANMAISAACLTVYLALDIYLVNAEPDELGGIAGHVKDGKVLRCVNTGPVQCSDECCGGIVGELEGENSIVESCYNRSFVRGNKKVGGIVGYNDGGNVQYCLNVGPVTAYDSKGDDLIGENSGTVQYNYFLSEEDGTAGTNGRTLGQNTFPSGHAAYQLNKLLKEADKDPIWRENLGTDFYPVLGDTTRAIVEGTIENPSLVQKVCNAGEFYLAVANPYAQISLQADIDLNSYFFMLSTKDHPFRGTIEGNGHTISNCTYQSSADDNLVGHTGTSVALFPFVENAEFKNFTINNFLITQKEKNSVAEQALLAAHSKYSTYQNITIRNSSIPLHEDLFVKYTVGGMVAVSYHDVLDSCTIESSCKFQGYSGSGNLSTYVGGFVAEAEATTFRMCHNAATIWADDDYEGGIAAWAINSYFDRCLNTGSITGQDYVAGIVGCAKNDTKIEKCVNIGSMHSDEGKSQDYHAGIVGYLEGNNSSITCCLNFGTVFNQGSHCGATTGKHDVGGDTSGNMWYCQLGNSQLTQLWDSKTNTQWTLDDIDSGKFAASTDYLYQSIDNGMFSTYLPVPIPAAGKVYRNALCGGNNTETYSNIYHCETEHAYKDNNYGICSLCGRLGNSEIYGITTISTPEDLTKFAYAVNKGVKFNYTVRLGEDIDMKDYPNFMPIGTDGHKYTGTFDGQGHVIKNLTISKVNDNMVGLFGVVGNATIKNVSLDSTCVIRTSGICVGGIVGLGMLYHSGEKLSLLNCGNSASVTGGEWVGGIIGQLNRMNETASLDIERCYNTGTITSTKQHSAAICGITRANTTINNSWNSGDVIGYVNRYPFIYWENNSLTINLTKSYNIETLNGSLPKFSADDITSGKLCLLLNDGKYGKDVVWHQNLDASVNDDYKVDATPVPYESHDMVVPAKYNGKNIINLHADINGDEISYSRDAFEVTDQEDFSCPVDFTAKTAILSCDMPNQWGTIVLPFDVTIDSQSHNFDLYKVSSVSDGMLSLSKITGTLSAGTPALVRISEAAKNAETGKYKLTLSASSEGVSTTGNLTASTVDGLSLTGAYAVTDITDKNGYIFSNNAFWNIQNIKGENKVYNAPFHAYLAGTLTGGAQQITLKVIGDSFTLDDVQAVADILVGKSSVTDVSRYDKNGEAGITIADLTFVIKILNDGGVMTVTPGSAPTASDDGIRGE